MSGSRARKVQPFTITTKLSLPKYSLDFPGDSCPSIPIAALDNHVLHQNLNERVSLYLAQAPSVPTGGRFGCTSPVEEVVINEDRINRNSLSRSIKKITLSNWHGEPSPDEEAMLKGPAHTSCERNCNNNNCRTGKAQFKISGCAVAAPWKENTQAGEVGLKPCSQRSTGLTDLCKWNPQVAQFNCDMMQAEKWVCAKLRGLKDGCSIQEWERVAQTLQRDMKDFENTMIKLNQMGEQLTAQPNPSAEIVRRLQTLREQWQLLKQTAANQSKAVGGLRNLQEFNQKAEQLEAWIRQKEEKPLLTALLQENADKIQLTRRILDLKQEEEQFQALHEQMNSLAHKLEKQEKSESRSIMARRKHLNKMWLRLQGTLKEHHETLHLALEAAAFLQQADVVLRAIHTKQRNLCGVGKWKEPETSPDLAVRDIAGQVMMLDVTVSQLISLHPSLMAQVSLKHQDVKESWAQLQQLLRSEKPPLLALTRKSIDSPSSKQVRTTMSNSAVREAGEKTVWEVQKDIQGSQESNSDSPGKEVIASDSRRRRRKLLWHSNALKDLPQQEAHLQDFCQVADGELHKRSPQVEDALEELEDLWEELRRKHQANGVALREIDTALRLVGELEEAECWLGTVIGLLSEPAATKNLDDLHGDLEKIGTLENQVGAWSVKLRALQKEMQMESSSEHTAAAMIQRKMESVKKKLACVQEALQRRASDLKDSVILTEFLQNVRLEEMLSQRNQIQVVPNQLGSQEPLHLLITQSSQQLSSEDMSRSLEELQEAVEMLNNMVKEREQAMEAVAKMETLKCFVQALTSGEETRLAWVTSQMETIRDRAETLAQDIIQAERSFAAVKSEVDLLELQGLVKRQKEIESDMSALEGDMEELERAFSQLQECYLEQISKESRRISEILEAWKDLQKLVLGNAVREQQAAHLRQFFRAYLAIISWTEDTRAQIFSESLSACGLSEAQWEELENNMETKFKEFEDLAAAGWKLVAEEHFLSETIKERMEELQSMLGWVMVRWRAQSSQADSGNKNDGKKTQDGILNMLENCQIKVAHEAGVSKASDILNSSVSEGPPLTLGSLQNGSATQQESESVSTAVLSTLDVLPVHKESVEESLDIPKESLILEPSETPVLLVPQPGPGSLGGTVNLILSIGKKVRREGTGSQVEGAPSMGQETLHKVSTYLHVKEKDVERDGSIACGSSTMPQPAKQMPPRAHSSPLPSTGWGTTSFYTLPKISSSFFLRSLKRKDRAEAGDAQLLTLQGIMGTEPSDLQAVQGERYRTSSTWPPKCNRRAQALRTLCPPPHRELTDYMKNPLAWAIDAECDSVGEVSGCHLFLRQSRNLNSPQSLTERMDNTCQRLSLGSVLSLELPKDPTVLRNIHDAIRVAKEGQAGRKGVHQACHMAQGSTVGAKVQENGSSMQKRAVGEQPAIHRRPIRPGEAQGKKEGTWFEEVSINPSYSRQKAYYVAPCGEERQSPKSQSGSSDDFLDFKQNCLSFISVLHGQKGWEWERPAASLGTTGSCSEVQVKSPADHKVREASGVKLKPSSAKHMSNSDAASNTTQVKNPAVNEAAEKESAQCCEENFARIPPSLLHLGFKSPTKLSVFEGELGHQEGTLTSSGLGPLVLAPGGKMTEGSKLPEACHPAHELFEEEEEELQAIWSNVEKQKRSSGIHGSPAGKVDKMQSLDSSGGKFLLTSADNLLVAKFKLPISAQLLQRSEGERGTSGGLDKKSSPSWCQAPIPSSQEPSEGGEATALGSLQGTCPMAQQKLQEEGRCVGKYLPSKLELQMMEGSLERKHLLQAGGKKANCRSWNTFHTVLMRQTLCFYQDKKDTLKSSVVALPLNLCGAICTLETEYTKKNNCFTLQLKDGSKYLLRAPTEPLMKEWITKLQQNSGLPEVDYFQSASQTAQGTMSAVSVIPNHGVSHFLGLHQPLTAKSQEAVLPPRSSVRLQLPHDTQDDPLDSSASQTENNHKSAASYTTEHSLRQCSPTEFARPQDPYIFPEEDCGLVTNKRRSYSFTSATYQKITPLSVSKEPLGLGSSYSVTLYIGEQAPAAPRPRCHSFIASSSGARETLSERTQGSSPRQKNKSVFRKFFGKKD
ncbi:uncharacterized protein LOC133383685 isoform X2 [Rhineura floridana]|uniref:uncharacterized protein LOC133383685 isoform X2 n=1 Tax=Rhineura floridana TaxID=261503 RepID=UPI002AC7F483|nr:uncharacterized protein LOC133383685 isoform X2 [Rhineura floridana]